MTSLFGISVVVLCLGFGHGAMIIDAKFSSSLAISDYDAVAYFSEQIGNGHDLKRVTRRNK